LSDVADGLEGILDEDVQYYSTGQTYYNALFAYSTMLNAGAKPIVELSFTPNPLASNASATCFHYKGNCSPPKDLNAYYKIVKDFVSALMEHFGEAEVSTWLFEVYNEPNLARAFTQADYFVMYNASSHAVKSVSSSFRVGGPATSQMRWLPDLVNYTQAVSAPLDFLSTHSYPSDHSGSKGDPDSEYTKVHGGVVQAAELGKPLYMTEWSSSPSSRDKFHDTVLERVCER